MLGRTRVRSALEGAAAKLFATIDRHPALFAGGIVALNLVIKLRFIDRPSLWLDEALTIFRGQRPMAAMVDYSLHDQNPPGYFLLASLWIRLFGISEAAVRSLSALCSAATAGAIAIFARRFLNSQAAVFAALLFTTSQIHLYYAQEARTYALVSLLCVLSFHLYLALFEPSVAPRRTRPAWRDAAGLALVNALMFYAHYLTAWILVVELLVAGLLARRNPPALKIYLTSQLGTALLVLPWLRFAVANMPQQGAYWLGRPTLDDLWRLLRHFAGNGLLLRIDLALLAAGSCLLAWGLRRRSSPADPLKVALLVAWAAIPIAADYAVAWLTPVFTDRYVLYSSIGLILLIAYLLSVVPIGAPARCAVALALTVLAWSRLDLGPPKLQDWRAAVAAVERERDAASAVVIAPAFLRIPFAYYFDREAFRDFAAITQRLEHERVFPVDRAREIDFARLGPVSKLIVLQPWHRALEPRDLLRPLGEWNYPLAARKSFQGLDLLVYRRRAAATASEPPAATP